VLEQAGLDPGAGAGGVRPFHRSVPSSRPVVAAHGVGTHGVVVGRVLTVGAADHALLPGPGVHEGGLVAARKVRRAGGVVDAVPGLDERAGALYRQDALTVAGVRDVQRVRVDVLGGGALGRAGRDGQAGGAVLPVPARGQADRGQDEQEQGIALQRVPRGYTSGV
jgi:hypothetical protein